jgi:hypothetical protein
MPMLPKHTPFLQIQAEDAPLPCRSGRSAAIIRGQESLGAIYLVLFQNSTAFLAVFPRNKEFLRPSETI